MDVLTETRTEGHDKTVDAVRTYRAAARVLLRDHDLASEERVAALVRLYDMAKVEPLGDIIVGAMVAEVMFNIVRDDAVAATPEADAFERAQRRVRAGGRNTCPTCLSRLLTDDEFAELARLREAEIRELEAREGAVL